MVFYWDWSQISFTQLQTFAFSLHYEVLLVSPLSFQRYQQRLYTKDLCYCQHHTLDHWNYGAIHIHAKSRWWFLRKDRIVNKRVFHLLFSIKEDASSHVPYYLFVSTFIFCSILKWYLSIYSNYILSAYFPIWLTSFHYQKCFLPKHCCQGRYFHVNHLPDRSTLWSRLVR